MDRFHSSKRQDCDENNHKDCRHKNISKTFHMVPFKKKRVVGETFGKTGHDRERDVMAFNILSRPLDAVR